MQRIRLTTKLALIALLLGSAILIWQRDSLVSMVNASIAKSSLETNLYMAQPAQEVKPTKKIVKSGNPTSIDVPSLNIKLEVEPGVYDSLNQTWNISSDKANYATNTPLPNDESGNTLIYGHNKKGVFNTLNKIKPNEKLILSTDNNLVLTYIFFSSEEVDPKNDSLFDYNGPALLTVQTCSGIFYQNRQLFSFRLESVAEIDPPKAELSNL